MRIESESFELERYRDFFLHSPEGIWCFYLDAPIATDLPPKVQVELLLTRARLAICNDAMAKMYGYCAASEMMGLSLSQLIPSDSPEDLDHLYRFVTSKYNMKDVESKELDRFGNSKYFLNSVVGVVKDGNLEHVWGSQRDITTLKQTQDHLRYSLFLQSQLTEISKSFITLPPKELDGAVRDSIEKTGRICNADRAYILEYSEANKYLSNTYEWSREGISSFAEYFQNIPVENIPSERFERIRTFGYVALNSREEIEGEDSFLREMILSRGIRSLLIIGLRYEGKEIGFFGMDMLTEDRVWTEEEISILGLIGDLILLAFDRKKKEGTLNAFYDRMHYDLELGRLTQRSLVDRTFPDSRFFRMETYFRPFEKVGGDVISTIQNRDGSVDILFADVSGHGISSAMVSGMVVISFKNSARIGLSPAQGLFRIVEDLKPLVLDHHISAVRVKYIPETKRFLYSYAGHPPIFLFRDGKRIELDGMNLPLLAFEGAQYYDQSIDLLHGDRVVFFSDGMYEIFDGQGNILDLPGLTSILEEYLDADTIEDYIDQVVSDLFSYSGGNFGDDIAFLVLDIY
ncbi:PAS domain S-box protein [Leptospira gomenensis]|uniref:PAS domain S-box protein n=1 Tax=Leptospira gomenensis TaxID=2484974 RepID=A0A5F1YDM6_9LEPT|nr:SpoIIE family protein phosphatase [Leptospira gomenensis]TGK33805.1 PAS domain S-box protein [Leptospira gomenensis]TGK36374.1 PAS domain S-box protein [Leptospira gomenensis]TGK47398.1 PAS domain S-box protein [Leptospira gomenensis]TGK60653.1 PAS domain S-box protein [Leptospira gomenensis]